MKIFGMGGLELVIILVVILIIFGPKNLPKLGKAIGKSVSSLREGMNAGKKKDQETESGANVEAESTDEARVDAPAEIEASVEGVAEESEEAAEVSETAAEVPEGSDMNTEDGVARPAEAGGQTEESGQAVAEDAPRKVVRRVVKKKVSADGAAESIAEEG